VLLGLLSLFCLLGLVPLGMLAYRQVRLPATPPRVAPGSGQLLPADDWRVALAPGDVLEIPTPAAVS
jgi:hypothetical protein